MENHDIRLKRLLYRSVYTGTKETDVFLGKFAQSQLSHLSIELLDQYESLVENSDPDVFLGKFDQYHLSDLSNKLLDQYESLVENSDPDLFMWISGQKEVPKRWNNEIMKLLKNFNTVC